MEGVGPDFQRGRDDRRPIEEVDGRRRVASRDERQHPERIRRALDSDRDLAPVGDEEAADGGTRLRGDLARFD